MNKYYLENSLDLYF